MTELWPEHEDTGREFREVFDSEEHGRRRAELQQALLDWIANATPEQWAALDPQIRRRVEMIRDIEAEADTVA